MGSNDIMNRGDFNAKISDAVDDLFNAVRQIEIDPATNEVRELGRPAPKAGAAAPALELEKKGGSQAAPAGKAAAPSASAQSHHILSKLDQSLMTLDWEVSRSNAGNMRDLLDKAAREYDLGPLQGEGGVISLMHKILAIMSDAPESVPTSGPLALKSSLTALKAAALEGQPYSAETRTKLEQAQNALLSVLPEQRGVVSAAPSQAPVAVSAAPPLPKEFQVTLKNHIARLDQLINKRLIPVEKFFGKTASLAKLYVVMKAVRQQLAEQSEQLKAALAGRYSNVMPVADPVGISIKLGNECQQLMQYHLQVLNHCARRVAPIEKLFADLEGQHKLHTIHFEIRSGLMGQLHYVAAALDGDFGPLPPLPKLAAAAPVAAPRQAGAAVAACPWPTMMVGRWRGEHVAFISDQVCFEGKAGFGSGNIVRQQSLKLKTLKSWPWSGLRSKFRSGLAEKTNKELASLEFPVLDLPLPASGLGGKYIVILFQAAKGGVVLIDAPLEELEIGDQYKWKASTTSEGDLVCGTICSDFGEPIPVVDVTRL
ncbi:MAG: hypothetical protein KKD73_12050 [Proteobacteria bacterium]|nr:hypothetical protein [Pseudomonadota bacterium]MBU1640773.1 hypothetical protein [Pseudomonadota bacterium]